jgi:hypothetical protein
MSHARDHRSDVIERARNTCVCVRMITRITRLAGDHWRPPPYFLTIRKMCILLVATEAQTARS